MAVMALLFWAGLQSGQPSQAPEARPQAPAGQPAPGLGDSDPLVLAEGSEGGDTSSPTGSGTPPIPEETQPEQTPSDEDSEQTSLQTPSEETDPVLPENWDELSPVEKIDLNPFDCDLSREEVDLEDGQCRQLSTLSSKSRPWNPMALNLVAATEVEDRNLKIACYNQDLTHLLNQPSQPGRPGAIDWPDLISGVEANSNARSPADTNFNLDNNKGSQHCVLRVVLEMTIDDFYFPNGCRTWRPGFVKLVGAKNGQTKTYNSLSAPGPNVLCTKVVVPIAKGQQIEQIFLFEVPDSDLNLKITGIRFDLLEPKINFSGNFGFETGTEPPKFNSLRPL